MKILIVEDSPTIASMLSDTLAKCSGVTRRLATQPSTALEMVKEESCDIVLIDLRLAESSQGERGKAIYNGIQLGEDIRAQLPGAVIVFYSGNITPGKETQFPLYNDCLKAAPDYILARETLLGKSANAWSETLLLWIDKKRVDQALARPFEYDRDWNTLAMVEIIGEECLSQLIHIFVPQMERDRVKALRPGYSGAFILQTISSSNGGKRQIENLLKISRSPLPLKDELRRVPFPGSVLDTHAVVPHTGLVNWQGWHAIGIRPVKGGILLREFLQQAATPKDLQTLEEMIDVLLLPPAKDANAQPAGVSEHKRLLGYNTGSQILDTLEQMSTWKHTAGNLQAIDLRVVRRFVEWSLEGHWNVCGNYHTARLHGDFHCRNVFVSLTDRPVLIDFGRSDEFPRLLDFATLDADVLLSGTR